MYNIIDLKMKSKELKAIYVKLTYEIYHVSIFDSTYTYQYSFWEYMNTSYSEGDIILLNGGTSSSVESIITSGNRRFVSLFCKKVSK